MQQYWSIIKKDISTRTINFWQILLKSDAEDFY